MDVKRPPNAGYIFTYFMSGSCFTTTTTFRRKNSAMHRRDIARCNYSKLFPLPSTLYFKNLGAIFQALHDDAYQE